MKHLFAVLFAVAMAVLFAGNVQAGNSPTVCNPIDNLDTIAHSGVMMDVSDAHSRHCETTGTAHSDTESTDNDNPTVTSTPVVTPIVETPIVTPTPETDKKYCNNGNGNGSEGCNASDKGNNDETEEKGDKGSEHPENGKGKGKDKK